MKRITFLITIALVLLLGNTVAFAGDTGSQVMNGTQQYTNPSPTQSAAAPTTAQQSSSTVVIQNFAFMPANITVPVGTTITWMNQDSTAHTVTGDTANGPNSGQLQPGQSYSFMFSQNGTFSYHCSIHPMMTGTVTVSTSASSGTTAPVTPSPVSSSTGGEKSGYTGKQMSNVSTQPAASTATTKSTSALPDTGPSGIIPAFVSAVVLGTGLSSLYIRRKISGV